MSNGYFYFRRIFELALISIGLLTACIAYCQPTRVLPISLKPVPAVIVAHSAHAEILSVAMAGKRLVAVGDHGVVLLSDDGSKSWRQAKSNPTDVKLTGVSFANDQQGWAVGHWGVVLHTRDGGETWDIQRIAPDEDRPLFAVHFFDVRHGVAVGLWSLVLVTEDGGSSWNQQTLAPPPGSKKADLNLLGLFPGSGGLVYAVAEKGFVLVSEDLGRDWRYLETGYKGSFWTGVGLSDGALIVAGLRGSIYRSIDEGRNWTRVQNSNSSSITALVANSTEVLGTGLEGVVLRSKDRGASFVSEIRADRISVTAAALLPNGTEVLLTRAGPVSLMPSR